MRNFGVYYGWVTIIHDWSPYAFVIFADKHPSRLDRVEDLIAEVPETYFYLDALGLLPNPTTALQALLDDLEKLKVAGVFLDRLNTNELAAEVAHSLLQTLNRRHFKIIANGEVESQYFSLIDYYMVESFIASYVGRPDKFQLEFASFTATEAKIRSLQADGAKLIALSYGEEGNLKKEQYCYLSAKLFGLDAFCYAHPSLMMLYEPQVHYDLGAPLDRYHLKQGMLIREFEQGIVVIDPDKRHGVVKPR